MEWFEALVLGLLQGLTEYLPVSSSGHLTIGAHLFGLNGAENLAFTVAVHVATVLSTIVILWREIVWIFQDLFKWKWNDGTKYAFNILISMIPVAIVGFFFKDQVEAIFGSGLLVVGICLLVTATLLAFSYWAKPLPGLSRSGSTIATGLLLGNKKEKLAQFSFLMVIPPILGEALLDAKDMAEVGVSTAMAGLPTSSLIIGFLAAFVSGCLACKWMIDIVKKGKLIWFALYCAIVGLLAIVLPLF